MNDRRPWPASKPEARAVAVPAFADDGSAGRSAGTGPGVAEIAPSAQRVLRNTYGLLGLTLAFSALTASLAVAWKLPHPGLLVSLLGYFGLLFLTVKLRNSAWGLVSVFALTGFMGATLGPVIGQVLSLPQGGQIVSMALGATALSFVGLSAYALVSRRDFGFMGGMLTAGVIVAFLVGLGAAVFQVGALALAVSAMVVLLMVGMILFETSRIVHGGETNYVMATVGLFVSIYNLFSALLALFGLSSGNSE